MNTEIFIKFMQRFREFNPTLIESIQTYIESSNAFEPNDISDFAHLLLMASTQAHIWHFNCDTMMQHELLEELYNDLQDWADKIAEIEMVNSEGKLPASKVSISIDYEYSTEKVIELLKSLKRDGQKIVESIDGNEGLVNSFGDLLEGIDIYLYKLTNLT